jgi:hypothetical protein
MIHCGCGFGFAPKPLDGNGVVRQLRGQTLQSYGTMKTGIFRPVNHTHAPTAEFFQNTVVRKDLAGMKLRFDHFRGKRFLAWLQGPGAQISVGLDA